MRRWAAPALLFGAGLAIVVAVVQCQADGPTPPGADDRPAGQVTLQGSRTAPGSPRQAAPVASPEPATEASERSRRPEGLAPLSDEDVERLLADVGKRGEMVLAEDTEARRAYQRVQLEGERAWNVLLRALRSPDRDQRIGAAAVLFVHARPDAGRPLAEALDRESDPVAKRIMVEGLAGAEFPDGEAALLRVWHDRSAPGEIRRPALAGLAALGHEVARAAVSETKTTPAERRLAENGLIRAYRRGGADTGLEELVRWISSRSPDPASRAEALEALSRR